MRFAQKWATCRVHRVRDVAPAIREFVLRPEGMSVENHAVGSHFNVGVLIDGRPETRCYSLVGEFSPDGYRIAVRRAPDSRGGSLYMWSLKPGARIEVSTPASLFEVDWSRKSYCLIAGGIGITPIIGIAGALMRRNTGMELHYAVSSRRDAAFLDELAELLGDHLTIHATKATGSIWTRRSVVCRRTRRRSYAVRCGFSKRRDVAGPRPDARRPICATRHSARAVSCPRNRFGSGSIIAAGRSWSAKTNRCWTRSTRPASR
jgi:ferredoxin-NADP reductase